MEQILIELIRSGPLGVVIVFAIIVLVLNVRLLREWYKDLNSWKDKSSAISLKQSEEMFKAMAQADEGRYGVHNEIQKINNKIDRNHEQIKELRNDVVQKITRS